MSDYLNKWSGYSRSRDVRVNFSAFKQRMALYISRQDGQFYKATNHNSNYAINYVIYGKANVDNTQIGWAPPFAKDN
ncbi:MAG: hypothetical protein AB1465_00020 [Patescibacteria group bacterium]